VKFQTSSWVVVSFSSCSCSQSWARRERFQPCIERGTLHEPFPGHITERTSSTRFSPTSARPSRRPHVHANSLAPRPRSVSRYLPVFTGASSGCCPARSVLYSALSLSLSPDTSTLVSSPVGILNRVLQVSPGVGQFSAVFELLMEWWALVPRPARARSSRALTLSLAHFARSPGRT